MMERCGATLSARLCAGALALAMAGAATWESAAQPQAAALVEQRQDAMKAMGGTFKTIVPIVKGESTDLQAAVEPLTKVHEIATEIPSLFPPGSGREAVPESRAKPEVWSQWAEFEAAADKLAEESAALLAAAKANDLEAFKAQFRAYAASCGGCHDGPSASGGEFRFARE